jgi:hypothetical protein
MRYEALIAAVLVLSQVGAAPATADPRDTAASPQFTAAETSTVGRNEILRKLIETDPWLVRQFLDAVAERSAKDAAFDGEAFVSDAFYATGDAEGPKTATASVELIELLRRVKNEKNDKKQGSGRSAQGSVELLETLKKARKEKGGK